MADLDAGLYEIGQQIQRLQKLAEVPRLAAPGCADALRDYLERQVIAVGRAPDGSAWERRKDDGGRVLEDAAKALTVIPVGSTVFARLKGPEARHHHGTAKGGTVRQILPTRELPKPLKDAFGKAVGDSFEQVMGVRNGR